MSAMPLIGGGIAALVVLVLVVVWLARRGGAADVVAAAAQKRIKVDDIRARPLADRGGVIEWLRRRARS